MSDSANVRSIQAIRDFKVALANFAEDARNALSSSEMEVRRTRDWLLRDQLGYWTNQIKRRNEQVSMARADLHRRRLSQQGSDAVSDTEQKEAVRLAQRKLEEAELKVKLVKKWGPILEHAIAEYHSTSQPLGDRLTGTLVNSMMLLDRMCTTLENYMAIQAKSTEFAMGNLLPAAEEAVGSTAARRGDRDRRGKRPRRCPAAEPSAAAESRRADSEAETPAEADAAAEPTSEGPGHERGFRTTEACLEESSRELGPDEGAVERPGFSRLREEPSDPPRPAGQHGLARHGQDHRSPLQGPPRLLRQCRATRARIGADRPIQPGEPKHV